MTQSQWESLTEKEKMWLDFLGSDVLQLKLNGKPIDMNSIDW